MIDPTTVSHHRGNKQPLVDATVTAKFTARDFNGLKSYNKYYKCSLGKLSLFIVNNSFARYLLSEPFLLVLVSSTVINISFNSLNCSTQRHRRQEQSLKLALIQIRGCSCHHRYCVYICGVSKPVRSFTEGALAYFFPRHRYCVYICGKRNSYSSPSTRCNPPSHSKRNQKPSHSKSNQPSQQEQSAFNTAGAISHRQLALDQQEQPAALAKQVQPFVQQV